MARGGRSSRAQDELRQSLEEQHQIPCPEYIKYGVCPKGFRCQNLHEYHDLSGTEVSKTLDFIVGQSHWIMGEILILKEQIGEILTKLQVDPGPSHERGREAMRRARTRVKSQMIQRSKSSDRASASGRSTPSRSQSVLNVHGQSYDLPVPPPAPMYNPPSQPVMSNPYFYPFSSYPQQQFPHQLPPSGPSQHE